MIQAALVKLLDRHSLSFDEAQEVMQEIMNGEVAPAMTAGFLIALRLKGETDDEVAGFASAMRSHAIPVEVPDGGVLVDTCGTGGDGLHTVNISTGAAFVAAGAGAHVAKHGNRAASGSCGSADVLEALGANIQLNPTEVAATLASAGVTFMFAALYHPAMRHAGPVRRELGVRTVFNLLGPLTNPAGAQTQLLGVADARAAHTIAQALSRLGTRHALVVHGDGGLDEIALSGPTLVYEIRAGEEPRRYNISPEQFGLQPAPVEALRGGTPAENAQLLRRALSGEPGPIRDVLLLNAAAALYVGQRAASLEEGVQRAAASIDSGAASRALDRMIASSHGQLSPVVA